MGKILIVDDDKVFLCFFCGYIQEYYPLLKVEACSSPVEALESLHDAISLLIIDLEMPDLDGMQLLQRARESGIDKNRIVILSGADADYLHERFPMGTCLAVLNKFEVKQKAALDMIFSSLSKKAAAEP